LPDVLDCHGKKKFSKAKKTSLKNKYDIMQIMSSIFLDLLEGARENVGLTVKNCYPRSDLNVCRRLPTICAVVF